MIITDKKTAAHEYFRRGQLGLVNCDSESAFLAGVEYANTWISIKEKLPPFNGFGFSERVLVKRKNKSIFIEKVNLANLSRITHWRPISSL